MVLNFFYINWVVDFNAAGQDFQAGPKSVFIAVAQFGAGLGPLVFFKNIDLLSGEGIRPVPLELDVCCDVLFHDKGEPYGEEEGHHWYCWFG